MNKRTSKDQYYLDLAFRGACQGTCLRRNYGAVIVSKRNTVVSTGYTGQPVGFPHCATCWRNQNNIPSGSNYEKCASVHAEQNAIIQAGSERTRGCDMYIIGCDVESGNKISGSMPCLLCAKMMVNAGIETFITIESIESNKIVKRDVVKFCEYLFKQTFGIEI